MTKIKTVFSLIVVLIVSLSFAPSVINNGGIAVGDKLETTGNKELQASLNTNNETLVLINYWAAYNAKSHIENIQFAKIVDQYKQKQFFNAKGIQMMSLSLEESKSVFEETVRRDNLTSVQSIHLENGLESEIAKTHEVNDEQFANFLLDSKGVIIAKNISPSELEKILSQN